MAVLLPIHGGSDLRIERGRLLLDLVRGITRSLPRPDLGVCVICARKHRHGSGDIVKHNIHVRKDDCHIRA
jgi:hypothetical protein